MMKNLKAAGSLLMYLTTGIVALVTAAWFSTQFIGRAISQTNAPQAVPAASRPNAAKPRAGPGVPSAAASKTVGQAPVPGAAKGSGAGPAPEAVVVGIPKGANPLADVIEDYTYVSKGKRDPFMPFERPPTSTTALGPLWPLQRFDLEQLKLVGIIWDVKTPKAMILDPTGKGYVVTVNERIGRNNGYIAKIREGEIIIVETSTGTDGKMSYQTKLMKLQQD